MQVEPTNDDIIAVAKMISAGVQYHSDVSKALYETLSHQWIVIPFVLLFAYLTMDMKPNVMFVVSVAMYSLFNLWKLQKFNYLNMTKLRLLNERIEQYATPNLKLLYKMSLDSFRRYSFISGMCLLFIAQMILIIGKLYEKD